MNPLGGGVDDPVHLPVPHEIQTEPTNGIGSNTPHALKSESRLVYPAQPTKEIQQPQAPKASAAGGSSSSTPKEEAPNESQPETQPSSATQAGSSKEPNTENQADTSSRSQTEEQNSDTPDAAPVAKVSRPVLTIRSSTYAYNVDSASHLIIAFQTASPGGPAVTVNGVKIALAPSANHIVMAGSTIPVQTPAPSPASQFAVGKELVTANSASQFVIHGQTLVPGASAITIDGTPISLAPYATQVVVGGSTIKLDRAEETAFPALTINGQIITANNADQYIVGGVTITPGAPAVTISGTPISIPADLQPTRPSTGIITAGSEVYSYTLNSAGDLVLASKTLVPGGSPITMGGETISEAANGTSVLIVSGGKTRTEALGQLVAPTGSASFTGSFTSSTGFSSSTTTSTGSAMSSATIPAAITTAAGSMPPINPTTSPVTGGATRRLGAAATRIGLDVVVVMLAASLIYW